MKTILFPTDFSLNSIHAIRYALQLFEHEEVEYILLNAYTDPSAGATMSYVWEDHMQVLSQNMLGSLLETLIEDYGYSGLKAECISQYGDLPGALIPIFKKKKIDLIVMGASGASGPNISIFGSRAYDTMRSAKCPVLTVPLQSRLKPPVRIGLASEVKLSGEEAVLRPLREIAALHSSWLMGVTVRDKSSVASEMTNGESTQVEDPSMEYIDISGEDPFVGIQAAIGANDIDMLAITIKKRPLLDRIFHKSVSKQVASEIALPILTLHETDS